ncbi:MAG: hypothetical protein HOP35_08185 [Nitrospira sp.]|nr:hypothetical protein [Nitrospira sp.]
MKTVQPRASHEQGIALLGVIILALVLALVGAALLDLAGQEASSVSGATDVAVAQAVADAAQDLVIAWFHSPHTSPSALAALLTKRQSSSDGSPSFFDQAGRSQFMGTIDRPDVLLDASRTADQHLLNDAGTGMFRFLEDLGSVQELKVYAPGAPGLLCTVDATVTTANSSARHAVSIQLSALEIPALRAAIQVGGNLGFPQVAPESGALVHWGDLTIGGDLTVQRAEDLPSQSDSAPVTSVSYRDMSHREDRWLSMWIGGPVHLMQLSPGQSSNVAFPFNVHANRHPTPGVRRDRWGYEQLKQLAKQHGTYLAIDRDGLLYPSGSVEPGHGVTPDDYLRSRSVGDTRGLIFVDTLDQKAPRADNLGVVRLSGAYLEAVLVVQGHVMAGPAGSGQFLSVLSPPAGGSGAAGSRTSVQLSDIHLNGALYAVGNITLDRSMRVFGAVAAEGTITTTHPGATMELWYDHEMGRGLFRGIPVVIRAPGTWMVRYE